MATEEGIVIELTGADTARVQTVQSSACKTCASRDSCHPGSGKKMTVEAKNPAGAHVGDRVKLVLESASLLKATFLVYLFPILFLLGGAIGGQVLAPFVGLNPSGGAAILGFICFFSAVFFMKVRGNQLAGKDRYMPKIIRVIGKS